MNVHLDAHMGIYLLITEIDWEMSYLKKSFSIEMYVPQNAQGKDASKPTRLVALSAARPGTLKHTRMN